MADFCKACSIELFGEDGKDLANLGGHPSLGMGWKALCEGCGFILVNEDGECICCDLHPGEPGHGPVV